MTTASVRRKRCHPACLKIGEVVAVTYDRRPGTSHGWGRVECDECGRVLEASTHVTPGDHEWQRLIGLAVLHAMEGKHG